MFRVLQSAVLFAGGPPRLLRLRNRFREARRWRHMIGFYLIGLGLSGALILKLSPLKDPSGSHRLTAVDALFFSMGAVTGSSLATVRVSELSTAQSITILFLMLLGGRIFFLFLQLIISIPEPATASHDGGGEGNEMHESLRIREEQEEPSVKQTNHARHSLICPLDMDYGAFAMNPTKLPSRAYRSDGDVLAWVRRQGQELGPKEEYRLLPFQETDIRIPETPAMTGTEDVAYRAAVKCLSRIVLGYMAVVQFAGILSAVIYLRANPDSQSPLRERGLDSTFFAVFTTISSFANCGYVQLNEGMVPFQSSTGLLWIFVLQMALGNAMLSPSLRAVIWWVNRFCGGNGPSRLLKNPQRFMAPLFEFNETMWIAIIEAGFIALQLGCLIGLQWNTKVLGGLTPREKLASAVYESVSTRSTGINVVNMVDLSPTIIYLYAILMYIPSEPVYLATRTALRQREPQNGKLSTQFRKFFLRFGIFVVGTTLVICIIENERILRDPLNFSILNMVFEVTSAFGNVGLSVGYSCNLKKQTGSGIACEDVPYSLSGKWTCTSKLLLILVMLAGRLR